MISAILAPVAGVYLLWALYVVVMALKRARDAGVLTKAQRVLGAPLLVTGYVLDVAINLSVFTLLFLELPHELLVTSRLIRHKRGNGWRSKVAVWFCASLLDSLDPSGCHCNTGE